MLNNDERMFAIEDARTNLAVQLDLIKFQDQKAVSLLSLYVTIAIATVGLSLTTFSEDPLVSPSVAAGLGAASWSLFVGALYCFKTIEGIAVSAPGRTFAFWKVALDKNANGFDSASRAYILDGIRQNKEMSVLNSLLASRLRNAKQAGIAAPVAAAIFGIVIEFAPAIRQFVSFLVSLLPL